MLRMRKQERQGEGRGFTGVASAMGGSPRCDGGAVKKTLSTANYDCPISTASHHNYIDQRFRQAERFTRKS